MSSGLSTYTICQGYYRMIDWVLFHFTSEPFYCVDAMAKNKTAKFPSIIFIFICNNIAKIISLLMIHFV